jgi:pimeloyl-ACP methyl ester carboxylesterase
MPEFASFDGTRIAYHEWPGATDQPAVVLLHGFIAHATLNWVGPGVVDAFTRAGRRVFAIDARGHGASEKHYDPARYGEGTMARDVSALFDLIGEAEVDLVGYSMGAIIALLTTVNDARVRRLVVGGIGSGVVEVGGLDTRALPRDVLAAALLSEEPPDPTTQPGAFRAFADLVGSDRRALAAAVQGAHTGGIALDRVTVPTLVVAGDTDPLATRPEVLANAIDGAKLVVLPGDHLSVLRDPGFIPAVVDFVTA